MSWSIPISLLEPAPHRRAADSSFENFIEGIRENGMRAAP